MRKTRGQLERMQSKVNKPKRVNIIKSNRRRMKTMPTSRSELQSTINELEETVEQVSDLVDEALDPELSREEVVAKLKEIQEAVAAEEEEEEKQGE